MKFYLCKEMKWVFNLIFEEQYEVYLISIVNVLYEICLWKEVRVIVVMVLRNKEVNMKVIIECVWKDGKKVVVLKCNFIIF